MSFINIRTFQIFLIEQCLLIRATNVGKTEYLLRILETEYKSHFEFIVIMCPTILDNNETFLSSKWIFHDNVVFIVCDMEGKLNYLEIH